MTEVEAKASQQFGGAVLDLSVTGCAGAGAIAAGVVVTFDPTPTINETGKPAILTVPIPVQRANRPIAMKGSLAPPPPLPPRLAPAPRRVLADVRPSANVPPAPAEADAVRTPARPPNETSDTRSRLAEAPKVADGPKAEGPSSVSARSASSFKMLPASCWSGGASRWQWWSSSRGGSCK